MTDDGAAGDEDFELRPGETVHVEGPEATSAARRFRDVLGRFASGVTVISAMGEDGPAGLTVQSFASVSLDPPLVMLSVARSARSWPVIERAGAFCATILAADQAPLAVAMSTRGIDKFAGLSWTPSSVTGSPVLAGGLGHVDCRIGQVYEAGDHLVVLGQVVDLVATDREDALLFYRGQYGVAEPEPPQFI
jgi:3-hydroxy-9,10-secoandrosta-1,3,5(10)-triene-9,17-dione monooxygenase reductase component